MRRAILTVPVLIFAFLALMSSAFAEKRVALVIGNSAYQHVPALLNPANDARDIAATLRALGFDVIEAHDLNQIEMLATVRRFSEALDGADAGLFFYAGHGMQVSGVNYLVPIDAKLARESDLSFEAVTLDLVVEQVEREASTALIFLDACRDNPMAQTLARSMGTRSVGIGRGLARIDSGVGTFIAFSTQPGNVALDGQGRNSPFTAALVKHVVEPGKDLSAMMIAVRNDVYAATDGKQVPWENSSLRSQFFFRQSESVVSKTAVPQSVPTLAPQTDPAAEAWAEAASRRIELDKDVSMLDAFNSIKLLAPDIARNPALSLGAHPVPDGANAQSAAIKPSLLGQFVVLVGAKRNQTEALWTFADMQQKYPTLLTGYRPMVQKVDLGVKGVWYRLKIGPMSDNYTAINFCRQLKAQGHPDCLVMAAQ